MAVNLLDMLQSQLGGAAMSQIGKLVGADESKASSAMGAILPTILGSVMSKGSSSSGAAGLMNMLNDGGHDGGIFDNLGSLLGGGESSNGLMNTGGTVLNFLMGNKTQAITDMIMNVTGMGKGPVGSMLRLAAPMVIGMIGKQVKSGGLNAKGLMDLLAGQKDHVAKAAPAGMGSLLGLAGLGDNLKGAAGKVAAGVGNTANAATATAAAAASEGKSMLSKILPIAVIAALAIGAWAYFNGTSMTDAAGDMVNKTTGAVGDAAGAVGDVAGAAAGAVGDAAGAVGDVAGSAVDAAGNAVGAAADAAGNAAGAVAGAAGDAAGAVADAAGGVLDAATATARKAVEGLKFAAGSAGEGLNNMFKSGGNLVGKKVAFKNLNFATGSANITASSASEVQNLAQVLKAYPNYKIEVGGHTDNTGNAEKNMELSKMRAASVQAMLTKLGVAADRISVKGYGVTAPTATNDTAEGRAANRRIEVTIVK